MVKKMNFFFLLILLFSFSYAKADEIVFVGDLWPPFNAEPLSEDEGYLIDIVREIFEGEGHTVKYSVRPWTRAIMEVKAGTFNALLGPFKSEAPGFIFPKEEIGASTLSFYTKADSTWIFNGIDSLKEVRLGVIQDYNYRPWLQEYRTSHPENFVVMPGEKAIETNIKMLLNGRIDVIPTNMNSFLYRAKTGGYLDKIRFAGRDNIGESQKIYIAFSPNHNSSNKYADILSTGLIEMRASGRLQQILAKYGLIDWK